ncbi:hypothetical protein [Phenylobacterium sp.]|jgi:hypothetical protein|uniref:hypothetical protein n=1 Tax=Phenylobacterium sp. TaxID=1871053 RepID=UPI002F41FA35
MATVAPYDLLRPFLWIALAAFLCGFGGYLVLSAPAPQRPERAQPVASPRMETAYGGGPLRDV